MRHSPDFLVVGGYPVGQENPDEYLTLELCGNCRNRLRAVKLPEADPLFGESGPLMKIWPASHVAPRADMSFQSTET